MISQFSPRMDSAFIERIAERFPGKPIVERYIEFSSLDRVEDRMAMAANKLASDKLEVWRGFGVTVEHLKHAQSFPLGMSGGLFLLTPDHIDREKSAELLEVGRLHEAITGGVTSDSCVTEEECVRLNRMAISAILKQGEAETLLLWSEYQEQKSAEARWSKDVHELRWLEYAYNMERKFPNLRGAMEALWNERPVQSFNTDTARRMVAEWNASRQRGYRISAPKGAHAIPGVTLN